MLSNQLKNLRKREKMSQNALAEKLFVSQQAVAKWEKNISTPNPDMLIKIAEIFDVTVDDLLGITDEKKSPAEVPASEGLKKELSDIMDDLDHEGQKALFQYAQFLAEKKREQ